MGAASDHPSNGREGREVMAALARLDVPRDGVALVHSAFRSFGADGFDAVSSTEALVEYLSLGTLLLPTMSWRFVRPESPVFDELATPSNTGVLTEVFRTRHAERRSIHPTHSVSGRGGGLAELLGEHHRSVTPCDEHSPFGRLADADAWIVMLGVGVDCCTLVHHVEEMVAPELYVRDESAVEHYRCTDRNGCEHEVRLRRHLFLPRDFWQFQDTLAEQGALRVTSVDNSVCLAFRAVDMQAAVRRALERDPAAIIARRGQRYRMM